MSDKKGFLNTLNHVEQYIKQVQVSSNVNVQPSKKWYSGLRHILIQMIKCILIGFLIVSSLFLYEFELHDIQLATVVDWLLFIAVSVQCGSLLMLLISLVEIIKDYLSSGKLLNLGFTYIKQDYSRFWELETYLVKRPIKELQRVHMFLDKMPAHSIIREPLQKTIAFIFSITALSSAITYLFVKSSNSIILIKFEQILTTNIAIGWFILEIIVSISFLLIFYYMQTTHIYKQKTDLVLALLNTLISSKK